MSNGDVKEFWNKQASEHGDAQIATHKDIYQRELEITAISRCLRSNDRVLDVGCGNGFSTRLFSRIVKEIVGIDYSSEMIAGAQSQQLAANITFKQADILTLGPENVGMFDAVVTERCLINLDSWDSQCLAIKNIHSVLKPGGSFIFCEGNANGRTRLNQMRSALGLPVMPNVWHNIDFDRDKTLKFMADYFTVESEISFGLYDLIARVVHPLLSAPSEPAYDAIINKIAKDINLQAQGMDELSRVLFLVLRKKS